MIYTCRREDKGSCKLRFEVALMQILVMNGLSVLEEGDK